MAFGKCSKSCYSSPSRCRRCSRRPPPPRRHAAPAAPGRPRRRPAADRQMMRALRALRARGATTRCTAANVFSRHSQCSDRAGVYPPREGGREGMPAGLCAWLSTPPIPASIFSKSALAAFTSTMSVPSSSVTASMSGGETIAALWDDSAQMGVQSFDSQKACRSVC